MDRNTIFFAWNRSIPGREQVSGQHFEGFGPIWAPRPRTVPSKDTMSFFWIPTVGI